MTDSDILTGTLAAISICWYTISIYRLNCRERLNGISTINAHALSILLMTIFTIIGITTYYLYTNWPYVIMIMYTIVVIDVAVQWHRTANNVTNAEELYTNNAIVHSSQSPYWPCCSVDEANDILHGLYTVAGKKELYYTLYYMANCGTPYTYIYRGRAYTVHAKYDNTARITVTISSDVLPNPLVFNLPYG